MKEIIKGNWNGYILFVMWNATKTYKYKIEEEKTISTIFICTYALYFIFTTHVSNSLLPNHDIG